MKYSASLIGASVLFGAVSCKDKEKTVETGGADESVVEKVAESVKEAITPKAESSLSDEERAQIDPLGVDLETRDALLR